MSNPSTKREYSLDFCKAAATCLIIFHHYQQTYGNYFTRIAFFDGRFYFGYLLELFFIISGYFSLHLVANSNSGNFPADSYGVFLFKRVRRLLLVLMITAFCDQLVRLGYQLITGTPWGDGLSLWGPSSPVWAYRPAAHFSLRASTTPPGISLSC